jgi:hypothetical protein
MPKPTFEHPTDPSIMNDLVEANGEFSRDAGNCLIYQDPMKVLMAYENQHEFNTLEDYMAHITGDF